MTKLEEKLIELGYVKTDTKNTYFKTINNCRMWVLTDADIMKIRRSVVVPNYMVFETKIDIDNLQQAYNQLQKDLKVLKEYE